MALFWLSYSWRVIVTKQLWAWEPVSVQPRVSDRWLATAWTVHPLGGHFCLSFQMGLELISLTMLTLNLWQSHLIILSAGNTGVRHHAQLIFYLCRFFLLLFWDYGYAITPSF